MGTFSNIALYCPKKCENDISTIFWKSHDISITTCCQTICRGLVSLPNSKASYLRDWHEQMQLKVVRVILHVVSRIHLMKEKIILPDISPCNMMWYVTFLARWNFKLGSWSPLSDIFFWSTRYYTIFRELIQLSHDIMRYLQAKIW